MSDTRLYLPAAIRTYSTAFGLAETPLSESGTWTSGGTTGLDWLNVQSRVGGAYASAVSGVGAFNDPTAVLGGSGTWSANQQASGTVRYSNPNFSNVFQELELRLRTTITAHSITGYEITTRCAAPGNGNRYLQIVRWNGTIGSFDYLSSSSIPSGPGINSGDVITANIVGNTITALVNGAVAVTVDITSIGGAVFTSGAPGLGVYLSGSSATSGMLTDFFWQDFQAQNY